MANDVTLNSLDYTQEIIMQCDASEYGLGAVLVQRDKNGAERPVTFISKTLKKSEKNAHIYKKELFAVIWAYSKFKQYIQGQYFKIETDNRAVHFLKRMREKRIN